MRYRGIVEINVGNEQEIMSELEPFLSKEKTDKFGVEVKVGNQVRYTTTGKIRDLIENQGSLHIYERVDESAESDIRETQGFAEPLLEQIKKAAKEGRLENYTLEDALKDMGSSMEDLEKFIDTRMDNEFAAFMLALDDVGVTNKDISKDIREGVESVSNAPQRS